ncbi:MAG: topoisomerase IV, partial [Oscillospiraceae bacterium]|nr:topoisomerase IV [Oscillospiraceae bacterium]
VMQDVAEEEDEVPDYPVHIFLTKEGYFKKVTPQSLRMSGEHKFKEGDSLIVSEETTNNAGLLFFTDKAQVYKSDCADFADTKISLLGEYIPARLQMDEGEKVIGMVSVSDYKGYMMFFYENGRVSKVEMSAYETKTKRKKLINAYCEKFPLTALFYIKEETEFMLKASSGRILLLHSALVASKTTKDTQGIIVMQLKKNAFVSEVEAFREGSLGNAYRFRAKNLPAAGAIPRDEDLGEQLKLELFTNE